MNKTFAYDVFLSHSSKDKKLALDLIRRFEADGLRVWFYEREIRAGEHILTRIEAGLNASRILMLAVSKNGMGSEWATLEAGTFLSRDPTNKDGRFIPIRVDNTELTGILRQFLYLDWRKRSPNQYAEVLRAIRRNHQAATLPHASIARVYDFFLGGSYNTTADRAAARVLVKRYPGFPKVLVSNRAFLRRAVRYLSKQGINQFIDIGSGLPTRGNTHEIAQGISRDAKVVYVDFDKQVVEASVNLMKGDPNVRVLMADVTDPDSILSAKELEIVDLAKPVGLLLAAVLHFVTDDGTARFTVKRLRQKLVPGSYLVISHASRPPGLGEVSKPFGHTYRHAVAPVKQRSHKELLQFFRGTALVPPGLVFTPSWKPEIRDPYLRRDQLPFTRTPEKSFILAGVGRL